mmetsp:Transcript_118625/g.298367  ORF Transcript_118625/g.298367 Transcript_118625/m.298367 type:complete len:394 (+) Transcript_118625:163-1344(+)
MTFQTAANLRGGLTSNTHLIISGKSSESSSTMLRKSLRFCGLAKNMGRPSKSTTTPMRCTGRCSLTVKRSSSTARFCRQSISQHTMACSPAVENPCQSSNPGRSQRMGSPSTSVPERPRPRQCCASCSQGFPASVNSSRRSVAAQIASSAWATDQLRARRNRHAVTKSMSGAGRRPSWWPFPAPLVAALPPCRKHRRSSRTLAASVSCRPRDDQELSRMARASTASWVGSMRLTASAASPLCHCQASEPMPKITSNTPNTNGASGAAVGDTVTTAEAMSINAQDVRTPVPNPRKWPRRCSAACALVAAAAKEAEAAADAVGWGPDGVGGRLGLGSSLPRLASNEGSADDCLPAQQHMKASIAMAGAHHLAKWQDALQDTFCVALGVRWASKRA